MAVFTAIATAIVTAVGSIGSIALVSAGALTTAGVIATSVIAGGLAYATSKITGVFDTPKIDAAKDPGVKVQLPPATDNRIPVFYGRNVTGSIIVDAEIKNRNNTMVYACIIGEKTDSGTYTVNKIYRGDGELQFAGGYAGATSSSITGITDPNATTSTRTAGKIRCRVYAGNAQSSANQIFPPSGVKVAAQSLMSTITATTNYEDLVYAIFEIDYDPENGLTDFNVVTFDITNSLSEPSNVMLDYIKNDRYGAGLTNADLDLDSFDELYDYSSELVDFTTTANVTNQHARWQIDGMLSTYVPVKSNIDKLCQSCATYFTYDPKGGKFKVVPNRAATTAEKNDAFVFNDDNILGKITIATTELYSLYNRIEVEYPEVNKKDQTNLVIIDTPTADRNTNEPDNPLSTRYDLVNDKPRVHNLANIDLRQSRISNVIEFEADYSAIQVDVGDVVKVTNAKYGYSDKLYRVMQVSEKESESGSLTVLVALLEYADSVYEHNIIQTDGAVNVSGIPGWWTGIWGNIDIGNIANIVNGNVTIVDDPTTGNANLANTNGNIIGNVGLGNTDIIYPPYTPPGMPVINVPITVPEIPGITEICTNLANMNVAGIDLPGHFCYGHVPANNEQTFEPGSNVTVPIPIPEPPPVDPTIPNLPINNDYLVDIDIGFIGGENGQTEFVTVPAIPIHYGGGGTTRGSIGPVQAGLQEEQTQSNTSVANAAAVAADVFTYSPNALVSTNVVVELGGIDEGEFSSVNTMLPAGAFFTDEIYTQAYRARRDIAYKEIDIDPVTGKHTANANADVVDVVNSGGQQIGSLGSIPSALVESFEYSITGARGSALAVAAGRPAASNTKVYVANTMTISHYANTDLIDDAANGSPRQMRVTNQDKRIGKGDDYIPIIPPGSIGL